MKSVRCIKQWMMWITVLLLPACTDYEEETLSDWCVIQSVGQPTRLLTDHSEMLQLDKPFSAVDYQIGERLRIVYLNLSKNAMTGNNSRLVQLLSQQRVLIQLPDSVPNTNNTQAPVQLNGVPFIGGGYLNVDFRFLYEQKSIKHSVSLRVDTLIGRTIYVQFKHFTNGDRQVRWNNALVSFPMNKIVGNHLVDSISMLSDQTNCILPLP
jgi:hypothetical protein